MAWTAPRTWTPGEFVTALMMNTHVRDNMLELYSLTGAGSKDVCNARLTLASATPVALTDQADKTTLYVTPFNGNEVGVYDGSTDWDILEFAELSIDFAALTASKPYDIFGYSNAGTFAVEALVWTNDTTRATALALQDGILVKSGATTRRFLGSVYLDSGGKLQDTALIRYVSNYYNRFQRLLRVVEATASWSTSTSWRSTNNSAANVVKVLSCYDNWMELQALLHGALPDAATYAFATGIGEDSTAGPVAEGIYGNSIASGSGTSTQGALAMHRLEKPVAVGRHDYNWLDYGSAAVTCYGTQTGTYWKSLTGMVGHIMG